MIRARSADGRAVLRLASGLEIGLGVLAALALLLTLALGIGLAALALGYTEIGWQTLFAPGSDPAAQALWEVRAPRIAMAVLAGWCIGLTGAILQSLSQNPLADPGLLGLSQGAMVTILLVLILVPGLSLVLMPLVGAAGGLAVALALVWLAGGVRAEGLAILLMGIGLETALSSISAVLILYAPPESSYAVSDWLAGSLSQSRWSAFWALLPWAALSLPLIVGPGRALPLYDLGPQMAQALGEPVAFSRPLLMAGAVLVTSAAVSAAGPLSFLGVMAPHLAQALCPASGRARLVLAGLTGAVLVLAADLLSRAVSTSIALPTGLAITLVGVPLFVFTLRLRALAQRTR